MAASTEALRVKILGAGSIGNHLANASRRLGWPVVVCDIDPAALERTRNEIYPARYGRWDEAIELCAPQDTKDRAFDLVIIGTPPDVHVELAREAIAARPKAVLIEKPVCGPSLEGAEAMRQEAAQNSVLAFVGYDHAVGRGARAFVEAARQLESVHTLDVEFREYWGGIFAAHPWLDGPWDTYLGFWQRGGGASGEHSHAIHLWQHFAHELGLDRVTEVTASMDYVRTNRVDYDQLAMLNLRTASGVLGRVVQDVVTSPPRKWARVQGSNGFAELEITASADLVRWQIAEEAEQERRIEKTRPDDFVQELEFIQSVLTAKEVGREASKALDLDRGLDAMLVVAAAHRSAALAQTIRIDSAAGCTEDALIAAGLGPLEESPQ